MMQFYPTLGKQIFKHLLLAIFSENDVRRTRLALVIFTPCVSLPFNSIRDVELKFYFCSNFPKLATKFEKL